MPASGEGRAGGEHFDDVDYPRRAHGYGPIVWDRVANVYRRRNAPGLDVEGRPLRTWIVRVYGYDDARALAFTRGQALYMVSVAFRDAFGGSFRDFLARGVSVYAEDAQ